MTDEQINNLDAMNKAINLLNLTNESHYIRQVVELTKICGVDRAYSLAEEQAEAIKLLIHLQMRLKKSLLRHLKETYTLTQLHTIKAEN
jgi:hypothetical protein